MFNLQKPNLENLQHVRKQFVERGLRNKLNPITNQYNSIEQKVSQKYKKRNEELESLMKTLEPPKVHDNLEVSSTASDAKQKDLKEVDPEYYNLLHQNDGQNDQHRYISESKSMGLDVKAKNQPQTTKSVTRKPVINKKYKSKNSAVAVFPSYGVSVEKSPFWTTNQFYDSKKQNEDLDYVDRAYFRQVYGMKTYMEEMLKAKNMRGEKK